MPHVLIAHPGADVYGSDRQLLESIAGLRAAGWQVTVVLPAPGPLVAHLAGVEIRYEQFPVLRKALLTPLGLLRLSLASVRGLVRLARLLRRTAPDIVYVNTVTIPLWLVAARLVRLPVLVHVHEAEAAAARALRVALNSPMLLATAVVANSAASRDVLVEAVPRLARRIEIVPNGVPDHGCAPYDRAVPDRLVVVARLSPRKGVDVALEAAGLLRSQGRPVELDVCGSVFEGYEWFEEQLGARAARPDLAGAVQFHGYVEDVTPLLATAAVVLVPSRVEPFGNTAVEGQLACRPVVASGVQGLTEIIQDGSTGLLVAPDDAPALAAAVARVLDDRGLAQGLGSRARTHALDRFGVQRYRTDIVAAVAGAALVRFATSTH